MISSGTNLIEASAGTGKTQTIAGLFVRILLEAGSPASPDPIQVDQILVLTYTEAATEELRERIRGLLVRAQLAFEAAKVGAPAGSVDDAVRGYYTSLGYGPDYKLPGLSHRTGHGIGMDGHEPPYLVRSDSTPMQPGMCFSDEPGIYIPGEFGIRLEDCWYMTEGGPKLFTPLATSIDDPV